MATIVTWPDEMKNDLEIIGIGQSIELPEPQNDIRLKVMLNYLNAIIGPISPAIEEACNNIINKLGGDRS